MMIRRCWNVFAMIFGIIQGMEKVATDIYSFARMREEGFTYVDKTEELYAMASGEYGAQFFMVRPRRFGKSLMVFSQIP